MNPAHSFSHQSASPPSCRTSGREKSFAGWLPLVSIIALAVTARAWLHFTTPYVPGINGGYYLVQARSLIEHGVLGIPDMPLTFYLHAALASLLAGVGGMAQADAIVWAVKLGDSALPPLVAWPVFVLVRRWAARRGLGDGVPLAAAALVCLASPLLGMVGDSQKNSLALVWLASLAMTLHGWLDAPTRQRGAGVLVCLLLLALTHIGVLGAAVVMLTAVMLVFIALHGASVNWRHLLPWMAAGAGVLGLAAVLVLWKFDPSRIHRLITALTNPAKFASDSVWIPMMPRGVMFAMRLVPTAGFALTVIPPLIIVWRQRRSLPAADAALVAGVALTVLALTGPWFRMDKMIRFSLIAMQPAVIVAAFAILHITAPWRRWAVLGLALCAGIGSNAPALQRGGLAILSDAAMSELKSLSQHIKQPENTLVCAQHGPEWWSAWFLRTRISQSGALRPNDWQRYDEVYFLEVKSGLQMPQFGPPGTGLPGAMPPMPGKGANPFMSAQIPPDAEVLHDGPCLKFARVLTPPLDILLKPTSLPAMKKSAVNVPRAVPTFECMGLYWDVPEGGAAKTCAVKFRAARENDCTAGRYQLAEKSPGHDDGARLPNFNDDFQGQQPDRGAHEAGAADVQYGTALWRQIAQAQLIQTK